MGKGTMDSVPKSSLLKEMGVYVQSGNLRAIFAFLKQKLASGGPDFEVFSYLLCFLARIEDHEGLRANLEMARHTYVEPPQVLALAGFGALVAGDVEGAINAFHAALDLNNRIEVFTPLAMLSMPGPQYSDHLGFLHRILNPAVYLEIGIFSGNTLKLAHPETHAIGIDPFPLLRKPYPQNTSVFGITSNRFFDEIAPIFLSRHGPISFVFIDGLHLFEQVLLDFIHVEKYCDRHSVVAIHDTLPIAEFPSARSQDSLYWCGDAWKVVACLERYRPDLCILTLPSFPSGLTLITGLDPRNSVLSDYYDRAVNEFVDLSFSVCQRRIINVRATIKNCFGTVAESLGRDDCVK
jgi:hypothetical protein